MQEAKNDGHNRNFLSGAVSILLAGNNLQRLLTIISGFCPEESNHCKLKKRERRDLWISLERSVDSSEQLFRRKRFFDPKKCPVCS